MEGWSGGFNNLSELSGRIWIVPSAAIHNQRFMKNNLVSPLPRFLAANEMHNFV